MLRPDAGKPPSAGARPSFKHSCSHTSGPCSPLQYMGFKNTSCDAGVPPKSAAYGNTVGPLLRSFADSRLWKRWDVAVKSANASVVVATVKNWFPGKSGRPR